MSASLTAPGDALQLPLDGIRAVEASAGTGKTFTIATLYLRLILERDLKVDEIVVATFTRAAAAELSTRLRQRLMIADTLLGEDRPDTPRAGEDGEHLETRRLVARALANGTALGDLRTRAREARLAIDTAFIGTLHGFCHRVLAEFGFETGQALAQPELLEDIRDLEGEIVRDFWRRGSADVATAALLTQTWGSPEALAGQVCDPRWRGRKVMVSAPDLKAIGERFRLARHHIANWNDVLVQAGAEALAQCVAHPPTLKQRTALLRELQAWASRKPCDEASTALAVKQAQSLCAKALDALKPKGLHATERVFDDIEELCAADAALVNARTDEQTVPAARLLREARTWLEGELPQRLAARNLMGHDQAVERLADALADAARGRRAAERIRARWKAALVDEFQDTDPRQWRVVETLFGTTTLVLVGDPKQAIYGFRGGDVFAWLQARAQARGEALRLAESWRAGTGLCKTINALFSMPHAFIDAGIEHPDIHPAAAVAQRALLRGGEPLPALELWWLDPERVGHAQRSAVPSKAHAFRAIQQACVAWISRMLHDNAVRLRDKHGALHTPRPGHIAVLVDSNAQAHSMQAALGRTGVPASCNLRASVYASDEAADIALLLDALATPDDPQRARAARASLLAGDDAATIAAGIEDDARQAAVLEGVAAWAAAAQQHGPMAWLHGLVANAAPRLLALPDGERRVANYLQLAELLQELDAASFGLADLATLFARARVEARENTDAARLRLDTDADAVTISTVHAAKGLEYEVVLVPYAVLARDPGKQDKRPPLRWYHDDANAAHVTIGAGAGRDITQRACNEIRAEDVRKFYVAVTRACALCVLPWGPVNQMQHGAVYHLLHSAGREVPLDTDATGCDAALRALCERAEGAARTVDLPLPASAQHRAARAADAAGELHARAFTRTGLQRDWQVWSFSRLVRGSANQAAADPRPGAGDASSSDDDARETGPGGAAFGSAVHTVFEQTDFAAWRDADGTPESSRALIERALADQGLAGSDGATRRAMELTGQCVRVALNAALPCGARLCDVAPAQRKAEIEFHLSLAPARAPALYALLHAHGYQRQRGGVVAERLHGLLTGKIDLTFQHAGRFHIVDWKTNRCAPYDDAALRAEIAVHDYDLQWLIYTLALHRWLRQQLSDYDYDRHVGAVYYLFVRGMGDAQGVHVDRPPRTLIEAMDAMFDARTEVSA